MVLDGWMSIVGLLFLSLCQGVPDTPQSCVYGGICVLPCTFQTADELVIHWAHWTQDIKRMVHSYHSEKDQLGQQDKSFINRTSLFHDQITNGNASLKLMGVTLQDKGRYQCYTSNTKGNKEIFYNVSVKAPVVNVTMELAGDTVTCTSRGIYPKPTLSWSTSPLTNHTFHNSITGNAENLYNISSTLTILENDTQSAYICSIGTDGKGKTITLTQLSPVTGYGSDDVTIPCQAAHSALKDFSVTWLFNHTQTILNYFPTTGTLVTDQWKDQAKIKSESGALQLSASSMKLEGVYICELSHSDDTYVTYTNLKINQEPLATNIGGLSVGVIAGTVIAVSIIIIIIIAIAYISFKNEWICKSSEKGTKSENLKMSENSSG